MTTPLTPNQTYICRTCNGEKPWTEFPVKEPLTNSVGNQCKLCQRTYGILRRTTPHGIAVQMWGDMLKRAGNRDKKHNTYKNVKILFTRAEWYAWAEPRIDQFLRTNAGQRPSIDRIDSTGNYEFSNLRIISWEEHRKLKKQIRWQRYIDYLATHPEKLAAFVQRNSDKFSGGGTPQQIIGAIQQLTGTPLTFAQSTALQTVTSNPQLLTYLLFILTNAK